MRTIGALALVAALAYLIWRMQARRSRIERIPLVLDAAVAVGVAAAGLNFLVDADWRSALVQGVLGTLKMAAALGGAYLVAWVVGLVPGWSGVKLDLEVPVGDHDAALRFLRHRLAKEGFELERPRAGADLVAFQGGNKAAWDRRERPKRLWAVVRASPRPDQTVASLRVRYVPPAMGLDKRLLGLVESMLVEGSGSIETPRAASSRTWFPIEFLVVAGFFVFFMLMSFYRF